MYEYEEFIGKHIINRRESMFLQDVSENEDKLREKIAGKSVLVIGGAGSIGAAFIEAVLHYEPSELYVIDTNENGLAELTRWLRSEGINMPEIYCPYPMDYSSEVFRKMFINHRRDDGTSGFDIVANFSAHKHVRSEKDIYSVEALLRNNVINAKKLLDLLEQYPPETFFCVSTDKAANPVNIMGASKRIMEDLIFAYSNSFSVKTARFANVAFSNGSLLDGFINRINSKQPLSAPSDVKRYFVSQREAGQICMLSAITANNREILFPKLSDAQMMKFDDIAINLLKEQGYIPYVCKSEAEAIERAANLKKGSKEYPVYFSKSDTSGEKMYEEFYLDDDVTDMNRYRSLGVITDIELTQRDSFMNFLMDLEKVFDSNSVTKEDVVDIISDYLPEFNHIEKGKSLDVKM